MQGVIESPEKKSTTAAMSDGIDAAGAKSKRAERMSAPSGDSPEGKVRCQDEQTDGVLSRSHTSTYFDFHVKSYRYKGEGSISPGDIAGNNRRRRSLPRKKALIFKTIKLSVLLTSIGCQRRR